MIEQLPGFMWKKGGSGGTSDRHDTIVETDVVYTYIESLWVKLYNIL
jgi:hypothetical protein